MLSVSIIMPMYNAAAYIESAIESVLAQTYSCWELIIVDDCSTDASTTIVEKFLTDSRIHLLINTVNSGTVVSRNKAMEIATGEIIAFLDSDDCWHPQKLAKQIAEYDLHPQTALVFCNYEQMDARGHCLDKVLESPAKVTYHTLLKSNCIGCLTATYNRVLLGKRFFIAQGHEDYILWLSILKHGHIATNIGECLAKYRISTHSLSANKIKAARWQWFIYRRVEQLSIIKSSYYFMFYVVSGLKKHFTI